MKRPIALLFCLLMISMPMAGCLGGSDDSEEELIDWNVYYAASIADLPECEGDRIGQLHYIEDITEFQVCKSTGWEIISVNGADGQNGSDGQDGATGPQGPAGADGADGADGQNGANGQDGAQGPVGPQGSAGADGADGASGDIFGSVTMTSDSHGTTDTAFNILSGDGNLPIPPSSLSQNIVTSNISFNPVNGAFAIDVSNVYVINFVAIIGDDNVGDGKVILKIVKNGIGIWKTELLIEGNTLEGANAAEIVVRLEVGDQIQVIAQPATSTPSDPTPHIRTEIGTTVSIYSLGGLTGAQGLQGPAGPDGNDGADGQDGADGVDGANSVRLTISDGAPAGTPSAGTMITFSVGGPPNNNGDYLGYQPNVIDINGVNQNAWFLALQTHINSGGSALMTLTQVNNTVNFQTSTVLGVSGPNSGAGGAGDYYTINIANIAANTNPANGFFNNFLGTPDEFVLSWVLGGGHGNDGQNGTNGTNGADGAPGPQGPAGVGDLGCTTDQIIKWNDSTTSWECYDQITNSISDTESGDVTLFDDGVVRIWLNDSTSDDIELEITNNLAPPGSVYHVSWTNFQSPSGTPGSTTNMIDLNAAGATSSSTLDFSFTTDEYMTIRIWSPVLGLSWGFYEISIIKSSSLYTGSPVICSVTVS